MLDLDNVGEELIRLGWRQGCVLKVMAAQKSWLTLNTSTTSSQDDVSSLASPDICTLQQQVLDKDELLVATSQTCDIQRSPKSEPYVEALRAFWTSDRGVIHDAGKNSVRHFLVQRRMNDAGKAEGLIADATVRIQIDKVSLLKLKPLYSFDENDRVTTRRFRKWLAKRYDRPALADELVIAIQKPIIKAIGRLRSTDDKHRVLDGISEILFLPHDKALPLLIDMLFIRDERSDAPIVSEEDAATLAGWISEVLRREGKADLTNWEILSLKEISVYDYIHAYELPTDQYSLAEAD